MRAPFLGATAMLCSLPAVSGSADHLARGACMSAPNWAPYASKCRIYMRSSVRRSLRSGTTVMSSEAWVLVTGANRGLGYATARSLVTAGESVIVGARSQAAGALHGRCAAAGMSAAALSVHFIEWEHVHPIHHTTVPLGNQALQLGSIFEQTRSLHILIKASDAQDSSSRLLASRSLLAAHGSTQALTLLWRSASQAMQQSPSLARRRATRSASRRWSSTPRSPRASTQLLRSWISSTPAVWVAWSAMRGCALKHHAYAQFPRHHSHDSMKCLARPLPI